jgi:glutathione synthase/RimK-type ligase-like ATP-grasp enzyme
MSELPDLDADDALLVQALEKRGLEPRPVVWDAVDVEWATFPLVLIRSTWDYHLHRPRFLAWAERVASVTTLANPLGLVRWNTHKRYLRDLEARGVPVVPTAWIDARTPCNLQGLIAACGWHEAVLKPAVSAGAHDTIRVYRDGRAQAQPRLEAILARGDAMLQPYIKSVEDHGERSLLFFDGHFSHAVRKRPVFGGAGPEGGEAEAITATDEELAFAAKVLAATPLPPVYARVDIVRGPGQGENVGPLLLMELELVEPTLFFRQAPESAGRFADALARLALAATEGATPKASAAEPR